MIYYRTRNLVMLRKVTNTIAKIKSNVVGIEDQTLAYNVESSIAAIDLIEFKSLPSNLEATGEMHSRVCYKTNFTNCIVKFSEITRKQLPEAKPIHTLSVKCRFDPPFKSVLVLFQEGVLQ